MNIQGFIAKFAEVLEMDNPSSLTPQTAFKQLDEWTSLTVLLIIQFVDEEMDVALKATDIRAVETVEELYNLIINK